MNKKGFTLIELLAILVVIGVISLITIPSIQSFLETGDEKAFLVSARQIAKAGKEYQLLELRERDEECVYFDFGKNYEEEIEVDNKKYIPLKELGLEGDLPKEGELEVCQEYVDVVLSNGDNTVTVDKEGKEESSEGSLEENKISKPVIDSISNTSTSNKIDVTVISHDDLNDIVKYYYYLNGKLVNTSDSNLYSYDDLKQDTSYKIKVVVENEKGYQGEKTVTIKTQE